MNDLKEQVKKIRPGDWVRAKFETENLPDHTIIAEGVVRDMYGGVALGTLAVRHSPGTRSPYPGPNEVSEILEHRPAKRKPVVGDLLDENTELVHRMALVASCDGPRSHLYQYDAGKKAFYSTEPERFYANWPLSEILAHFGGAKIIYVPESAK